MIGLKRGTVKLFNHSDEWEIEGKRVIELIKKLCCDVVIDIAHIGSTSVKDLMAKPIIDIAVAVDSFVVFLKYVDPLMKNGFYYCPHDSDDRQLLFGAGSYYTGDGEEQTHFIHVVKKDSMEWLNYINFRNYLSSDKTVRKQYENLKLSLANQFPFDRAQYVKGKNEFINATLRTALVKSYVGKNVRVAIDRPVGTPHPKHPEIIYPINYGYIPGVFGGDGEELDVYILGTNEKIKDEIFVKIVGIVYRKNDVEDKLVASIDDVSYTAQEIENIIHFQEQFYDSHVEIE